MVSIDQIYISLCRWVTGPNIKRHTHFSGVNTDNMVNQQLAFSVLQLVALSLPAFAILLQMMVESDMAYTKWVVPITTAGMGLFLVSGGIFLIRLIHDAASTLTILALGLLLLGILTLIIGASLIGWQTAMRQRRIQDHN